MSKTAAPMALALQKDREDRHARLAALQRKLALAIEGLERIERRPYSDWVSGNENFERLQSIARTTLKALEETK